MGTGSKTSPLTMAEAMSYPLIRPGHTVYLRGNKIKAGDFDCKLQGTKDAPILIRSHPDDPRAQVDGAMAINAPYTTWVDVDLYWSGWTERVTYPQKSMDARAEGVRLINCNIHDYYYFGLWDLAAELYGTIILNNGVLAGAHSLYTQNTSSERRKKIRHNFIGKSFGFNLHAYSTTVPNVGFDISQNVLMPGRNLYGGEQGDRSVTFTGNCTLDTRLEIGYGNDNVNIGALVEENYLFNRNESALQFIVWDGLDVQNNIIIGGGDVVIFEPAQAAIMQTWDNNRYYTLASKTAPFAINGETWYTLESWRERTGFDKSSTIGSIPPDAVFVWPNEYAAISRRKGAIVIYNHTAAKDVTVEIAALKLAPGKYRLIQATDPLVDVTEFEAGDKVTIDMRPEAHSVAIPIKHDKPLLESTFPVMGAFMVEAI